MQSKYPDGSFHQYVASGAVEDLEEARKRRVYSFFLLISTPSFVGFGLWHLLTDDIPTGLSNLVTSLILILSFFLLKKLRRGLPIYRTIALMYSGSMVYWSYSGAMDGYALIWLLCFPLIGFSFLEKKRRPHLDDDGFCFLPSDI